MRQIRLHTNVIHLIGHIKSQRRWPNLGIIMEFAANDTIKKFLQKHPGIAIDDIHGKSNSICNPLYEDANAPTPEKLVDFIGQIANGMQHLSDMNIIHRKLGARNVFLDNKMVCKIGSFSMAIRTTETEKRNNMELQEKLPIRWMALESLNSTCRKFSIKTDVWAFGILMWEILTFGKLPYPEIKDDDIVQHVANGNRMKQPSNCDTKLYDMMLRCWLKDSSDRPKFDVLVKDIQNLQSQIKNPESGYGNEKRRRDKRIPDVNRRLLKEPTDTDN
ncbi:tyrosine kinase receptor Cad96Ca-like [Ptychodera flava]|uniref:tyrosine kinase receptor Cad96Ca-like n=1 Tax=Ptychodera flava TaxID=63121 RepID=UPI00396A4B4D